MKLKPLTELPKPWCPVCDGKYTGAWAMEAHNLRCSRFGERSYWRAAGIVALVVLFALAGYVEGWVADSKVWGSQIIANCPNHSGIRHPNGRIEMYPPCEPIGAKP